MIGPWFPVLLTLSVAIILLLALGALLAKVGYLAQVRWRPAKHDLKATVVDLRSMNDLETAFNAAVGAPRLVLLFSPACPVCFPGALWVRSEILNKHPSARLKVLAVWFNMVPGDSRHLLDTSVLCDPRVTYFWDQGKIVGRWFAEHVTKRPGITWDAYFLYGPEARWDGEPAPLVSMSSADSVIASADQLEQAVKPFLSS